MLAIFSGKAAAIRQYARPEERAAQLAALRAELGAALRALSEKQRRKTQAARDERLRARYTAAAGVVTYRPRKHRAARPAARSRGTRALAAAAG